MTTALNFLNEYREIRLNPTRGDSFSRAENFVHRLFKEDAEGAALLANDIEEHAAECVESTGLPPGRIQRIVKILRVGQWAA